MLAAPTGGERDNAMRFTNVDVSLRQRPIRKTRALPGARRQLQSEAVAGLHEERELVAVKGVAESGRTGGADQDNRPDDDVSRAFERHGGSLLPRAWSSPRQRRAVAPSTEQVIRLRQPVPMRTSSPVLSCAHRSSFDVHRRRNTGSASFDERPLRYAPAMASDKAEPLTAAQKAQLEAELAELEGPRRAEAVEAIARARGFGDLAENFEYHAAKNEQDRKSVV